MATQWGDLRRRVLSALVLLPIGLGGLWAGGWAWLALIALGAVGMVLEWLTLCQAPLRGAATLVVPASVALACLFMAFAQVPAAFAWIAVGVVLAWLRLRRFGQALGVAYVGLPALALIWLRDPGVAGRTGALFLLLVVWATDIGAYLVGRLVGGPRLAPAISPGKTWSGAVGGLAGAFVVGWTAAPGFSAVPVALLLSVIAQLGDLMESSIKRHFHVKDSGKLIPGHGGLFDRLDGVLTAAPAMALLVLAAGHRVGFWQ